MEQTLKKRHGAKDVVASEVGVLSVVAMFYAICCAGAFGIEEMIPECGPGLTIVMLLVLPVVWALPYSLICAEMGSARPVEGGNLMWVKEALGEFWFAIMVFCNVLWSLVCNTVYVVLGIGVFAVFARFFIGWNEGSWGEEYYLEEYETGIFSDFGGMLTVILVTGIVCLIVGIIVWLIGRRVE